MDSKITIGAALIIGVVVSFGIVYSNKKTQQVVPSSVEVKQDAQVITTGKDNMSPRYIVYSPETYEQTKDKKRVLFFHASWCPTCKSANSEFTSMMEKIPQEIVLLKTDYDTNSDLKKKYAITYQHTFVQVDSEGNEITKWNGGGIQELKENVL